MLSVSAQVCVVFDADCRVVCVVAVRSAFARPKIFAKLSVHLEPLRLLVENPALNNLQKNISSHGLHCIAGCS